MNFIKLKSGAVVNTAHIIHVSQSEHEGQIKLVLTDEPTPWLESMSIEDFQNLLRGPAVTPLVSAIIDLDQLKTGGAVQFYHSGVVKHGIIDWFHCESNTPSIRISSGEDSYSKDIFSGEVSKL